MKFTIANTSIRTDVEGRYCLNDLHKAAGGENRHRPSLWVENQQTKDLIAEIDKAGIPAIHSKQGLGTFVCKELVYSFAMWISPAFHLQVIRAYDSTAQGKAAGVSHQGMSRNRLAASVILLRAAAEDLKLPPSAVLGGYKKLEAELGVSGLLPDYAVDAPSSAVAGSSEVTKAAGELRASGCSNACSTEERKMTKQSKETVHSDSVGGTLAEAMWLLETWLSDPDESAIKKANTEDIGWAIHDLVQKARMHYVGVSDYNLRQDTLDFIRPIRDDDEQEGCAQ